MERFKRTFSFRKKKSSVPESSKPHQWQEDEKKVRDGTCSFQVKYLGCIEVFESRGIQVCEEAVRALKSAKKTKKSGKSRSDKKSAKSDAKRQHRSVWSRMSVRKKKKSKNEQQPKGKHQRAVLYVSGDALRVVDEITKGLIVDQTIEKVSFCAPDRNHEKGFAVVDVFQGLIVDQTIEKVSFCAPDRNHEKGFAYICRDGTTRRWMCHGFLAVKESGERMSHAVGCAFAICLEKKQKREKESVSVTYNDKGTAFTRMGSFRQTTLTERMADPQSAIIAEPVTTAAVVSNDAAGGTVNPASITAAPAAPPASAVERPRASADMLNRQASFRGFNRLADNSPFKRNYSLRLNDLPSNVARQIQLQQLGHSLDSTDGRRVDVIHEVSPSKEQADISELCNQIQGLGDGAGKDEASPFNVAVPGGRGGFPVSQHTVQVHTTHVNHQTAPNAYATQPQAVAAAQPQVTNAPVTANGTHPLPIRQTNPWDVPAAFHAHASPAESWLQSTATVVSGTSQPHSVAASPPQHVPPSVRAVPQAQLPVVGTPPPPLASRHAPALAQRSHTVDNSAPWYGQKAAPTLKELQQSNQLMFTSSQPEPAPTAAPTAAPPAAAVQQHNGSVSSSSAPSQSAVQAAPTSPWTVQALGPTSSDPFDAAWATKSPNTKPANPFQLQSGDTVTQTFKVQL